MIYFAGDINLTDWIFNVGFGIGTNIGKGYNPFEYLERKEDDVLTQGEHQRQSIRTAE